MSRIMMPKENCSTIAEMYEMFLTSRAAKGVAEVTLNNYRYRLKTIGRYLELGKSYADLTKKEVEEMVVFMRKDGLAHNTVATLVRTLRTFVVWTKDEGCGGIC